MIKVQDLRIGNWIYDTKNKPAQINEIKRHPSGEKDFAHIVTLKGLGHFGGYVEEIKPIELTPEILEKCGFEKINHRIDGVIYKKDWLRFSPTLNCEWRGGYIGSDIKYLHQLQNLFYSLTGKEIEVNL